jgi:hypothetical protein
MVCFAVCSLSCGLCSVAVVELELAACCALLGVQLNTCVDQRVRRFELRTVSVCLLCPLACVPDCACGVDVSRGSVTVVIFIMNFGLVVDYSAHIAHHFMTHHGTPRERAAQALAEMGSSVFNGAFTTALGMLPLIWAPFETGVPFQALYARCLSAKSPIARLSWRMLRCFDSRLSLVLTEWMLCRSRVSISVRPDHCSRCAARVRAAAGVAGGGGSADMWHTR